jgi:hypothetical protein
VENFVDSMPLKQLMKYFVNHLHPQNTSHDIPRPVTSPRLTVPIFCLAVSQQASE